jgi:V-type H+-transporting ATPase subunit H
MASAKLLAEIMVAFDPINEKEVHKFMSWLISNLSLRCPLEVIAQAVKNIQKLLHQRSFRKVYYEQTNSVAPLMMLIKQPEVGLQMRYEILFCIWLLTFEPDICVKIQIEHRVISGLVECIRSSIKEKVIRVCVAILRSLLEKAKPYNLQAMLDFKVCSLCQLLSSRTWSDEDILNDIQWLINELRQTNVEMSTFDEYAAEVRYGEFDPSAVINRSETFWKQNVDKLSTHDFELLRLLVEKLKTTEEPSRIALTLHDIGEYVRYCPRSKRMLQNTSIREHLMTLVNHEDSQVRLEALVTMQKFLVNNWEYLNQRMAQEEERLTENR